MQRVLGLAIRSVGLYGRVVYTHSNTATEHISRIPVFRSLSFTTRTMSYTTIESGSRNSENYNMYFVDKDGTPISPFHDIPLYPNPDEKDVVNMVVEIPRWSNHKMEINTAGKLNPIKQDVKKGKVRFVKNVFPHHGYIWNYGALPQTWEDPTHEEAETGTKGDQDPLDVCEIGEKVHPRGSVIQVKLLGVLCLVDEGETDWKVFCIDVTDPLADKLNDIEDVKREMPGIFSASHEWFKIYKIPDGKPENQFGFKGDVLNKDRAIKVVEETNGQWTKLIGSNDGHEGISCTNTKVAGSPHLIELADAKAILENAAPVEEPTALPSDVDKWYHVAAKSNM